MSLPTVKVLQAYMLEEILTTVTELRADVEKIKDQIGSW